MEITRYVSPSISLAIVTTEQDRIGRDTLDIIATIRAIWQCGAVPHFTAEGGALPRTPENELRMETKASVAQYERNKIRQRIQSKLEGKRAHGELCGTLSYGWNVRYHLPTVTKCWYRRAPCAREGSWSRLWHGRAPLSRKTSKPNPVEQKWLLQMHRWRQAGWSYGSIAAELNRLKVPTKAGSGNVIRYKGTQRFSRGQWQCGNVHKVLNSRSTRDWLRQRLAA